MSVRRRIALTIFATGLVNALAVLATMAVAFHRLERETTYARGDAFLGRVVARYQDVLDLQVRRPDEFVAWLSNLLLFEPDTQLYLLDARGRVLAHTGQAKLPAGFAVALAPVQQAAAAAGLEHRSPPYVMGDDPEHMNKDAVVAARALQHPRIAPGVDVAGYLYLVAQQPDLPPGRWAQVRSSLAGPALALALAVILLTTALTAWIVAAVTRPLRRLSDEVVQAGRDGFNTPETWAPSAPGRRDEIGLLRDGFRALLVKLRQQWDQLRALDRFRREGVSNLSHDLRSPLTATVACLETLDQRWAGQPAREADRALVEVALRNTRNAAQLVRSLGDLALLDEPGFQLKPMRLDLGEALDDIALRFADRAQRQGVALVCETGTALPVEIDIELFERAVANLLDNALKFTPAGGQVTLAATGAPGQVVVSVQDTGPGMAPALQAQAFDRLYSGAGGPMAPQTPVGDGRAGDGSKGLGLAIVKRIAELHGGSVALLSPAGGGTTVAITLPCR